MTTAAKEGRYIRSLDGLRCLAVVAVMAGHFSINHLYGTKVGVLVFFVLSGYLITSILAAERERTGRISLRAFYMRRALRLFPALVVATLAYAVYALATSNTEGLKDIPSALFYFENWKVVTGTSSPLYSHYWSLSVEEQFYVLWPIMMLLAYRTGGIRGVAIAASVGAAVSIGEKVILAPSVSARTAGLDYAADGLLLGCALAAIIASGHRAAVSGASRLLLAPAIVGLLAATTIGNVGRLASPDEISLFVRLWWPVAVISATIVVGALATGSAWGWLRKLLELKPLVYLGTISYGMYLWHILFLVEEIRSRLPRPVEFVFLYLATVAIATLSYRFIELPFLKLKRRYEAVPVPERGMAAPAATSAVSV